LWVLSFKDWHPDLEIRLSPEMAMYLILVHCLALSSLFLSAIDGLLFVLLVGVVVLSGIVSAIKNFHSKAHRVIRLKCVSSDDSDRNNWELQYADGTQSYALLHSGTVITPFALFLTFTVGRKKEKLILTKHNVQADEWRRLAVGLRYNAF